LQSFLEKSQNLCSGCFACYNICPRDAIEITISSEGFYLPSKNEKCTNCGLCEKCCPLVSPPINRKIRKEILVYAGWSRDELVRLSSSSGGIFTELARTILEMNGVVYGVVWDDEIFLPRHERAIDELHVKKMRGSKYLPSYVGKILQEVLNDLKSDRAVLFSGTPCQIAALKRLVEIENVNDAKLYTVDLICHGVPSIIVFKGYLQYISGGRKIRYITFRDKGKGWSRFRVKISFENGSFYIAEHDKDPFYLGFIEDLYLNRVCYNCPFQKIPRLSDITLGDFWGVPRSLRDERGVSIIMVNSAKGQNLLKMTENLELIKISLKEALRINQSIIYREKKIPRNRDKVIKKATIYGFNSIIPIIFKLRIKRKLKLLLNLIYNKL